MLKGYLTTEQTAERLKVSSARVRRMILDGLIKGVQKVGNTNLVPEKEVKRLEAQERKAGRPPSKKKLTDQSGGK